MSLCEDVDDKDDDKNDENRRSSLRVIIHFSPFSLYRRRTREEWYDIFASRIFDYPNYVGGGGTKEGRICWKMFVIMTFKERDQSGARLAFTYCQHEYTPVYILHPWRIYIFIFFFNVVPGVLFSWPEVICGWINSNILIRTSAPQKLQKKRGILPILGSLI